MNGVRDPTGHMQPGDAAPLFDATSVTGESVRLADCLEQPVWLAFFRFASCPLCNFRVHQLMAGWSRRFAHRRFRMIGVFQSPREKLDAYVMRHRPGFAVVADPAMGLYQLYGVEASLQKAFAGEVFKSLVGAVRVGLPIVRSHDGPAFRIPADFLIEPGGTIHTAFYGRNMADHIPFETVESWLDGAPGSTSPAGGTEKNCG